MYLLAVAPAPSEVALAQSSRPSRLLIVAAAGYGKSTALEACLPGDGVRCTAAEVLAEGVPAARVIGVDDMDELAPAQQADVVALVAALPPEVGVVLASRTAVDPAVWARLRGRVHERGPDELALGPYATARLLRDEYGVLDPESAERVLTLTAGWPALVHFAAEVLARDPEADLREALARPGTDAVAWVASDVLRGMPEPVRAALDLVAAVGPVTRGVVERVSRDRGPSGAEVAVADLRRLGVLVPERRVASTERWHVVPVVAAALQGQGGAPDVALLTSAAAAYEAEGLAFLAARAYARAGEHAAVERLVAERGAQMLQQGDARGLAELLDGRPASRSALVQRTHANALRMSGDAAAALRTFRPLALLAERDGWPPALASGIAAAHYMQAEFAVALEVLDRVDPAVVAADEDGVEWRVDRVLTMSMLGLREQAGSLAAEALAVAQDLGAPHALACAHLAMARTTTGARKAAHHEQALRAATSSGDGVMAARILVNQAHLLLASAHVMEACEVAREAVRLAELCSPPGLRAAALHNLGQALTHVGEHDEARWHFQRSIALCGRLGPGRSAMGLLGLADVHRRQGHTEQAHAAYLEAEELARGSGEVQVLVPALAGLARLLASAAPVAAAAAAQEAHRLATPALMPLALTALGWADLGRDDRAAAARRARSAVESARQVRAFDVLAEALELEAASADDAVTSQAALAEALTIWRDGGAGPAVARVEVLLGGLDGADATVRSQARDAAARLQRMGVLQVHGRPVGEQRSSRRVTVAVLGGFTVSVEGEPVPLSAWRSRQARTLVKVLAARRGRPSTRGGLCELLWPDDDATKTGHRLSVLLATVRGVLDPERVLPPDHHVAADLTGIWLDLRHVAVDADSLIRDADHAAELLTAGDAARAAAVLADVDARYRGDAFEDEPYEDWADGLREEARAAWLRCLRSLASLRSREGRAADAHRLLVRLLVADPYDEQVHRLLVQTLVRAGRYGEARRAFDRWGQAMRTLDASPPDPEVLHLERPPTAGRPPGPRRPGPSGARSAAGAL